MRLYCRLCRSLQSNPWRSSQESCPSHVIEESGGANLTNSVNCLKKEEGRNWHKILEGL